MSSRQSRPQTSREQGVSGSVQDGVGGAQPNTRPEGGGSSQTQLLLNGRGGAQQQRHKLQRPAHPRGQCTQSKTRWRGEVFGFLPRQDTQADIHTHLRTHMHMHTPPCTHTSIYTYAHISQMTASCKRYKSTMGNKNKQC